MEGGYMYLLMIQYLQLVFPEPQNEIQFLERFWKWKSICKSNIILWRISFLCEYEKFTTKVNTENLEILLVGCLGFMAYQP